jgi:hypothetical protein
MNISVYSARVNPRIDLPLCRKSRSYVQSLLDTGAAFQVDWDNLKAGVQLRPATPHPRALENAVMAQAVETLGGSNLIPFARGAQGKIGKPDSINYPIPAVGAHTRTLHCQTNILYREARQENLLRQRQAATA